MACSYIVRVEPYGEIQVIESIRCRRMTLRMHETGELRVSAPPKSSAQEIERFVRTFDKEITSYLARHQERRPIIFSPETEFRTSTRAVVIRAVPDTTRVTSRDDGENLVITYPDTLPIENPQFQQFIRKQIDALLRFEAENYLPSRVKDLADLHKLKYSKLDLRNMTSKWGSCSSTGRICLNIQLMRIPLYLIDMVILHELNHLRHLDHSPAFWNDLDKMCDGKIDLLNKEMRNWRTTY